MKIFPVVLLEIGPKDVYVETKDGDSCYMSFSKVRGLLDSWIEEGGELAYSVSASSQKSLDFVNGLSTGRKYKTIVRGGKEIYHPYKKRVCFVKNLPRVPH